MCVGLQAQTFSGFLNYWNNIPDPADRQVAVDSFMDAVGAFPYIESDTEMVFLFQGSASSIGVAGDFNGWTPGQGPLQNLAETDLWYRAYTFESNARLDYKLVLNGNNWILDPLNPNQVSGGFGPNSELAMPDYIQPWEIQENPAIPHGQTVAFNFVSTLLNGSYQVTVYLPPGYEDFPNRSYPSLYVQDGQEYLSLGSAAQVLDNLIDQGLMSEIIAVFIRPNNRNEEYAGSKRTQYRQFLATELVPHIDALYRTIPEAAQRGVMGTSFGGNISGLTVYHHSDVFGKCGLHSGAFWPNSYETYNLWLNLSNALPVRFAAVWGTYEGSLTQNQLDFQDYMTGEGYEFYGNLYPEGHSWGLWRATFDEILTFLFPPGLVDASEKTPAGIDFEVFPNPGQTAIHLALPADFDGLVHIFRPDGARVMQVSATPVVQADHLPAGLYFIAIEQDGQLSEPKVWVKS